MVKSIFSLLILIHGLIHLFRFFKAFHIGDVNQLSAAITKRVGIIWQIATVLFLVSALAYVLNYSF